MANALRIGSDGDPTIGFIPDEALAVLDLKPERVRIALGELERRVAELSQIFFLHEDETLWQEAAETEPLGMGADVLFLHEKRPLLDPIETFLSSMDLKPSVINDFRQDWASRQPVRLVIRGESQAWLAAQADQLEGAGRGNPEIAFDRTAVLASVPLGDDLARRLSGLGATVLKTPVAAMALRGALQV